MKIGAITIGQAPRTDVTADILHIFDDSLELVQAGGLDGLTKEQIAEFAPGKDGIQINRRKFCNICRASYSAKTSRCN